MSHPETVTGADGGSYEVVSRTPHAVTLCRHIQSDPDQAGEPDPPGVFTVRRGDVVRLVEVHVDGRVVAGDYPVRLSACVPVELTDLERDGFLTLAFGARPASPTESS